MAQQPTPQNILLVHTRYRLPGGEDAVFAAERALLANHGHSVTVYERANAEADRSLWQKLLLPLRAVYSFKTVREVRALIRQNRIELVHVHNTLLVTSPSVFWACLKERVPVVQTLHNFRIFCPSGVLLRGGKVCEDCPAHGLGCAVKHRCYRGSRAQSAVCAAIYWFHRLLGTYRKIDLIALTEFDRAKLLELNAQTPVFDPARLHLKPNPVDVPPRAVLPWAARKNQMVYAGRLEELKGLKTALAAWKLLENTPGAPRLIVAGDGPLKSWAAANAGPNVALVGQLTHGALHDLLAESKAAVAPSLCYESFALVPAEAHALGTPVLASGIGNVGASVRPGVDGLIFAPGDAAALAGAVGALEQAGPGMDLQAMAADARARYGREENYRELLAVYRAVAAGNQNGEKRS